MRINKMITKRIEAVTRSFRSRVRHITHSLNYSEKKENEKSVDRLSINQL